MYSNSVKILTLISMIFLLIIYCKHPFFEEFTTFNMFNVKPVYLHSNKDVTDSQKYGAEIDSNIYIKRRKHLEKACRSRPYRLKGKLKKTKRKYLLFNKKNNFLFCFVQKIGCTFWKRTFLSLENIHHNFTDLSLIHKVALPTLKDTKDKDVLTYAESGLSVLFVRDPYSRLFSGYVDKFFYINPHYWTVYGTVIISRYRRNATDLSRKCGHDVTFPEFIEYVVDTYEKKPHLLDDHFSPIYQHCRPCEINYAVIGKMETFEKDSNYVTSHLRDFNQNIASAKRNVTEELLQIKIDFQNYQKLNRTCLTDDEVSKRILKSLYYRGIINLHDVHHYNITDILVSLNTPKVKNHIKLFNSKLSKEEKRRSIVEHYKLLDRTLLERLRRFLKADCQLFGYNDRPDDIFMPS